MIKTKYGFAEWTNGYIALFVLDENREKFYSALKSEDLEMAIELACLALDSDGLTDRTDWPTQVTCKFQLINKIKDIRRQGNDIKGEKL